MFFLLALAIVRHLPVARDSEDGLPLLFALGAAGVGILLILGPEFFAVLDPLRLRVNTVLKSWYLAWFYLGLSGAFAIYWIARSWRPQRMLSWLGLYSWLAVVVLFVLAGLVYPVIATYARTSNFSAERTVDGLAFLRRGNPNEYAAIQWLNENVQGTPTLLEAQGGGYSDYARISSRTGLPTVLGWPGHEFQWRGSTEPYQGRPEDIQRIYTTSDIREAKALLEKHQVEYVYVGRLEQQKYVEDKDAQEQARTQAQQEAAAEGLSPGEQAQLGEDAVARFIEQRTRALQKFEQFMDVAYWNDEVTIYRLREETSAAINR